MTELLERVKARALEAQAHQDLPFEQVVERVHPVRSLAHSPLFQAMFAWQNMPERQQVELPGLHIEPLGGVAHVAAKFDLSLSLQEVGGRIVGGVEYATALFERSTVERYLGHWRRVLTGMVADDRAGGRAAAADDAAERRQVVEEWNRTAVAYPREQCVHELFEAQVARTPDAIAVVFEDQQLTYGELNRRANRLAHYLRAEYGVGPEVRVALCLERGLELVIAILGVLKAGGAYVPLDPEYPGERLRFILEDSGARLLLTRTSDLRGAEYQIRVDLDVISASVSVCCPDTKETTGTANSGARFVSERAAYVTYTSGSTGTPKGVSVPHRAIMRLVINNGYLTLAADDRVGLAADPAFDAITFEVWAPLVIGASIVVIPRSALIDPSRLPAMLARHSITTLFVTTAVLNQHAAINPRVFGNLRALLTGGEQLTLKFSGPSSGRVHRRT